MPKLVKNLWRVENSRHEVYWATSLSEAYMWLMRSECDGNA